MADKERDNYGQAQFEKLKQPAETNAALIQRLITAFEQGQVAQGLNLTQEEQAEIQEAVQLSGLSFTEIARQGLLTRARALFC